MARQIFPFSFGDEPNPNDHDFRPQRIDGDGVPKDSSALESAEPSPNVTTVPAPALSSQPDSVDSTSTPPTPSGDTPSHSSESPAENADAEKALQPIPLAPIEPPAAAPKRASARK